MRGDGACITGRGGWAGANLSDGMVTRLEISRFCQANSHYRVIVTDGRGRSQLGFIGGHQ